MDINATANFIRQRRIQLGLTQKELAEKLLVTDKAVSRWETAKGLPDTALLLPLSEILGASVGELLSGELIEEPEAKEKADRIIIETLNYAKKTLSKAINLFLIISGGVFLIMPLYIAGNSAPFYIIGAALLLAALIHTILIKKARTLKIDDSVMKYLPAVATAAALIIEALPTSAKMVFAGPNRTFTERYSYFNFTMLWGYGKIAPVLCAILTVALLFIQMISIIKTKRFPKLHDAAFTIGIIASFFSLLPILLVGNNFTTAASVAITVLLVASTVLQAIANRHK